MSAAIQNRRLLLLAFAGLVLLGALMGTRTMAMPFSALGENIHVYLLGGMSIRYDDNLYLSRLNKQADIITTVNAGFALEYGSPDTPSTARLTMRKNHVFYASRSEYNTDNINFNVDATYAGPRGSVTATASVTPMEYNTRDAIGFGRLVQGTNYGASITGVYQFTGKTGLSGGITYANREYSTEGYSDQQSVTVPVRVLYEVTAKTGVRAGYTYRATIISDFEAQDSVDHSLFVGTTREITSTLSGDIEIGLTNRTLGNGDSGTIVPVNGSLTWVASPRMVFFGYARRDFGNSALAGASYLQTLIGLGVNYDFAERWNAGAGISYEIADYYNSARVDRLFRGNVDLSYSPGQFVSMSAGYVLQMNDSTLEIAGFDSNVLHFSVNARY